MIDAGVRGHAPSVLIEPIRRNRLTVAQLIAMLQRHPQDAAVFFSGDAESSICEATYEAPSHSVVLTGRR
jgi:hypothetical protein